MLNEPRWLSVEQIVEFNRLAVEETGEPFAVRDRGMLESAWGNPKNRWCYGEADIVALAVSLLLAIARNHPFEQGNKRTGFAAADAFLYLNGYELTMPDRNEFADLIVQAITGQIEDEYLVSILAYSVEPSA